MARWRYDLETHKWIEMDTPLSDPNAGLNGPVYCPEGGYYDMVLNKTFETKEQKRKYMREKGLMMESGKGPKKLAGRGRNTLYFYQ